MARIPADGLIWPGTPEYRANEARVREPNQPCACCGRPVDVRRPGTRWVTVQDGGATITDEPDESDRGFMGCFPVGPECAKRIPAGFLVRFSAAE